MTGEQALAHVLKRPDDNPFGVLEQHLSRWTHSRSGDALLALAVLAAAHAESRGDACAELARLASTAMFKDGPAWPDWPAWQTHLARHPWVGQGAVVGADSALVLEGDGACYLARVWRDEVALAEAVRVRCDADAGAAPIDPSGDNAVSSALLADLFGVGDEDQRNAAQVAGNARLLLLTGPPGSGKTWTLLRSLLILRARAGRRLAILLAAPTGKAAQRIGEALRLGKRSLRDAFAQAAWLPWLDEVPDDALTLHRLLEYQPHERRFDRDARTLLAADVVAIDEASMVDLAMMRRVFDATPPSALLLLAGDPDQLASVAAGSVLADLVRAAEAPAAVPVPRVVRLAHSRRSDARFDALFDAVRRGDADNAVDALHASSAWHQTPDRTALERALEDAIAPAAGVGVFDALLAATEPATALALLSRWQCLCALRVGPFGSIAMAAHIEKLLRARNGLVRPTRDGSFSGRAVIIEQNDYTRRLFNGDIGVTLIDAGGGAQVWFAGSDAAGLRAFAPTDLPAHASGFGLTVHKAQGAEFDAVALILPPQDVRVLGRELVYTALTRARERIAVYATKEVFAAALTRPLARRGRLRERIRHAPAS